MSAPQPGKTAEHGATTPPKRKRVKWAEEEQAIMIIDREFNGNGGQRWKSALEKINNECHDSQSVRTELQLRDRYGNILHLRNKHTARIDILKYILAHCPKHNEAAKKALEDTEFAIAAGTGVLSLTKTPLQNILQANPDINAMLVGFVAGHVCSSGELDALLIATEFQEYLRTRGRSLETRADELEVLERLAAMTIAGPDNKVDLVDDRDGKDI